MLKSKYITKEDFKEYWGQDLENLIKEDDNPSATTERLLLEMKYVCKHGLTIRHIEISIEFTPILQIIKSNAISLHS